LQPDGRSGAVPKDNISFKAFMPLVERFERLERLEQVNPGEAL
jgi:hypothetical protein